MLKKTLLDNKAISYIRDELSSGGDLSIAQLGIDLDNGLVYSYLPINYMPVNSAEYTKSLEYITGNSVLHEFESITTQIILDYLEENRNKYVVFETLSNRGDPIIKKRGLHHFFINNRKYGFLREEDKSKSIVEYLNDAQGYPTIISMINIRDHNFHIQQYEEITNEKIQRLCIATEYLIIGAFDGEGYIFWQKLGKINQ